VGAIGVVGVVFGLGLVLAALPSRWSVALWRRYGWLGPFVLVVSGVLALGYPFTPDARDNRLGGAMLAVILGVPMLALARNLATLWWRTARDSRPRD
jgi:hypothetical protein